MLTAVRAWLREKVAGAELRELELRRVVHEAFAAELGEHPQVKRVLDAMQAIYDCGGQPAPVNQECADGAGPWTIAGDDSAAPQGADPPPPPT